MKTYLQLCLIKLKICFFILSLDHNIYISIHHYTFSDRLLFLVELLTPTKIRLFPLLEQQQNNKTLRTKQHNQIKQQNQTETKTQQHDEILNNHNHHARNTIYTRSKINTINRQEEQPKNLKHASIQPNGGGSSDQILAELIREMQQVTMATENLKKRFDQMLKLNQILSEMQAIYLINFFQKVNFVYLIKILIVVLGLTNITNKTSTRIFLSFTVILNLGHTLDQLKIIQMNLDLKAIAIGYQINYPAVLKPL